MWDILAGGELSHSTNQSSAMKLAKRLQRRQNSFRLGAHRRRRTPHVVAVQPGQLASPLLKFGFPSLMMH